MPDGDQAPQQTIDGVTTDDEGQSPVARLPLSKRWPTIATVVGGFFVTWSWMIGIGAIADNSFFTHLTTGRVMVGGTFPRSDIYSFTARGEPWVVQSWLASLVYGWVDSWVGVTGVRVLGGVLAAAVGALVWTLTRSARSLLPRVVCATFPIAIGAAMWAPRPLMFGLVGTAITMLCIEKRLSPVVLLPVYWIWANTHGSFPLGLVAIACVALGTKLDGTRKPERELRALAWAAAGTVAAVIGPLGPKVLLFPFDLLGKSAVLKHVVEWQSPDFSITYARIFLVQVALATVLLVRNPKYRAAVPLVVFAAAALVGLRNIPLAAIVITPGLARAFRDVGTVTGKETGVAARLGLAVVVLVAAVLGWSSLSQPNFDLEDFPVEAVAWMDQNGLRTPGAHVVTNDVVGNYLELIDGDRSSVFLDDRFDMYPQDVIADHLTLLNGQPGWAEVLDRREIDSVLWERTAPLVQLLSENPAWRVAYQDSTWAVVCRRGSPGC